MHPVASSNANANNVLPGTPTQTATGNGAWWATLPAWLRLRPTSATTPPLPAAPTSPPASPSTTTFASLDATAAAAAATPLAPEIARDAGAAAPSLDPLPADTLDHQHADPATPATAIGILTNAATFVLTPHAPARHAAQQYLTTHLTRQAPWSLQASSALFFCGFLSGGALVARARGRQFLAENAHRLPRTKKGWYNYHRFKQHEAIHAALFGGVRHGVAFGAVGAAFCAAEAAVAATGLVGDEGWAVGLSAGLATAVAGTVSMRLSYNYGKYAVLFGAGSGLAVGLLQDAYSLAYGESCKDADFKRPWPDAFFIPGRSTFSAWHSNASPSVAAASDHE